MRCPSPFPLLDDHSHPPAVDYRRSRPRTGRADETLSGENEQTFEPKPPNQRRCIAAEPRSGSLSSRTRRDTGLPVPRPKRALHLPHTTRARIPTASGAAVPFARFGLSTGQSEGRANGKRWRAERPPRTLMLVISLPLPPNSCSTAPSPLHSHSSPPRRVLCCVLAHPLRSITHREALFPPTVPALPLLTPWPTAPRPCRRLRKRPTHTRRARAP